jgi:hypothetical protein
MSSAKRQPLKADDLSTSDRTRSSGDTLHATALVECEARLDAARQLAASFESWATTGRTARSGYTDRNSTRPENLEFSNSPRVIK